MAREINLVPDIKNEMIKTLKLRNLIFFICSIVAAASVSITIITGLIAGGQQFALDAKKSSLEKFSSKVKSYSDLNKFLTIKDQLNGISELSENKTMLSRTFNILSALIPSGVDTITISELNIELESEETNDVVYSFEAQANAGQAPFIDYNVLDAFKKSMQFMRYDYGRYVDSEGNTIPAYCIVEQGADGATFNDPNGGLYAYWLVGGEGCDAVKTVRYATESYEGVDAIRIWRTPQFNEWYRTTKESSQPYMSLDGTIENVPHFESECITYTGNNSQSSTNPTWTESNRCMLVPEGTNGITIIESSNGKNEEGELVLRFYATINLSSEVYKFKNTHMLALAPAGRRNVTDSYVQVQAMFGKRAEDCAKDDAACETNNTNGGD